MRSGWVLFGVVIALQPMQRIGFAKTDAVHQVSAITWAEGAGRRVRMRSTERLPEASGNARVERWGGTTEVEIELDSMKPALLFGGDYNTYVLWVVPPGGKVENLGEVPLDGNRARVQASTGAPAFAILITAEPHYLVSAPSAFVVLENDAGPQGRTIEQPLIKGVYNFHRSTLDQVRESKGKVHTEVKQAFTAVRLAQRSGAATFAAEELAEAQHALDETLTLWRGRRDRTEIAVQARETVRLAVAAQRLAEERALQGTRIEAEGSGGGKARPEGAIRGVESNLRR
jgi:hypothetical protein